MSLDVTPTDPKLSRLWLSTQKMMRYINRTHSFTYTVTSRLPGGYGSGAYLITDSARSSKAVLKWNRKIAEAERIMDAAATIAQARALGWPTPQWLAKGVSPSGYPYVIQEYIDPDSTLRCGGPMDGVTIQAALCFLDTHRGLGAKLESKTDWFEWDRNIVFDAGRTAEHAEAIQARSEDGAAIVDILKSWQEKFRTIHIAGEDLVHGDFHPGNAFFFR